MRSMTRTIDTAQHWDVFISDDTHALEQERYRPVELESTLNAQKRATLILELRRIGGKSRKRHSDVEAWASGDATPSVADCAWLKVALINSAGSVMHRGTPAARLRASAIYKDALNADD